VPYLCHIFVFVFFFAPIFFFFFFLLWLKNIMQVANWKNFKVFKMNQQAVVALVGITIASLIVNNEVSNMDGGRPRRERHPTEHCGAFGMLHT
jgi:hypothetical protein